MIQPISHRIKVKFYLKEGRLCARDKIYVKRLTNVWDDINFTLWHQLNIDAMLVDKHHVKFAYGDDNIYRKVIVEKDELTCFDEQINLVVSYSGEIYYETEGIVRAVINPEIASLNPSFFPWYPQFDKNIDSIADVTLIVPSGYTVAATGALVKVVPADDYEEWIWHTDISGERFSFAIAQYISRSISVGGTPVSVHIFSEDSHKIDDLLEETKSIFEFYSERLGKYPFEKFAIASLPDSIKGGYAEASFIKLQRDMLGMKSGFLAHEIAHAWEIRAEGQGSLWLLESLGEYASHLYLEFARGKGIAQNIRASWALRYFNLTSKIEDYSLMDFDESMDMDHYFLYYNKGAWVWHILRQVLEESVFWKALHILHQRYLLKPVSVDDFRLICEETSERSLLWFFQEWLGRSGVPSLELADINTVPVGNAFLTRGIIRQQWDIYHLPVEIGIQTEQNEIFCVWTESAETRFEFETGSFPHRLRLDPRINILRMPNKDESLEEVYDTGRVVPIGRGALYGIADNDAEMDLLKRTT